MKKKKKKIGRNERCPCGSGRKYKRCCGFASSGQTPIIGRRELPPEVRQAFTEHQRQVAERIKKYGHIRPIISLDDGDTRFVAVGNQLHYSKNWKTFHDFLWDYIKTLLTDEWGNTELQKPLKERHPILQWYNDLCDFQRQPAIEEPGGIFSAIATGTAMAYTALAYDLYTLKHHALLQQRLVKRLKVKDQFQGARYETYVAAAFVRAGFDIVLEDEGDPTSKHCEFTATHKATGLKYSVEAKSRHRPGFLGQSGTPKPLHDIEADIYRLLQDALKKDAQHERIIFIDANVPPEDRAAFETEWFKKIAAQVDQLEKKQSPQNPWPPAFLFVTNHPYHYVGSDQPEPGHTVIFTAINKQDFKKFDPTVLGKYPAIAQLYDSVTTHTTIPHEF